MVFRFRFFGEKRPKITESPRERTLVVGFEENPSLEQIIDDVNDLMSRQFMAAHDEGKFGTEESAIEKIFSEHREALATYLAPYRGAVDENKGARKLPLDITSVERKRLRIALKLFGSP